MRRGEVSVLWGCVCPSLGGCVSHPCCSCQGVSPRRGSLQTADSRMALLVNPCLFGVSYRLGVASAQPGSVDAFAGLGASLQRSQNSRVRAAQTAKSRSTNRSTIIIMISSSSSGSSGSSNSRPQRAQQFSAQVL